MRGGGPGGRMIGGEIEDRDHLPLRRALAHERPVAAGAEGEREGVEQDRLARAGFARQHRQSVRQGQIERVDEDDVANGQVDEHAAGLAHVQAQVNDPDGTRARRGEASA